MTATIKHVTLKSLGKNKDIDPMKGTVTNPFTQAEYNNLNQTGEWTGGYVEAMGYVAPTEYDGLITILGDWFSDFLGFISDCWDFFGSIFDDITNSPFVQAVDNYSSGGEKTIAFDANAIGLNHLRISMLNPTKTPNEYNVNLFSSDVISAMTEGMAISDKMSIVSTAMTLGNITLIKVGDRQFNVKDDTYNFEMHDWGTETKRNILTIAGWYVNETLSNIKNNLFKGPFGTYSMFVARNFTGNAKLTIIVSGTLTLQP